MNERKKILIIDDEVDLCLLMKTYFLRKNYLVYLSHTFTDALPMAKEVQPDIIFLTSAICQHREDDMKKLKEAAPAAEIIVDRFSLLNKF